ncbi:MAG: prepilin-type N-terminal cleavage/methylation domain-containing protein [Oscillospiraceae bacterium]|nr:prepilin-type N-terminal cleavage/methylation domain-containing protein [Oscillospiraceae bacterium]
MQCGRARSGFTLAELAAAAAIMAIAAAVALPALAWVAASVRQSALDAGAEAVASAAQRSAAEMYLSGELTALYDSGAFAGEVSGEDGDFFYIIQGQSVGAGYSVADFFPSDALGSETSEGFFVVEYALSDVTGKPSGAVQSVFYSDETDLTAAYTAALALSRAERAETMKAVPCGCWTGDMAEKPDVGLLCAPAIRVHNGEELWLEIDFSGNEDIALYLALSVVISDGENETELYYPNYGQFTAASAGWKFAIILDTLRSESYMTGDVFEDCILLDCCRFRDLAPVRAGENIALTVTLSAERTAGSVTTEYLPRTVSCECSSLFAEGSDPAAGIAVVSAGRHLQNLEESVSGLGVEIRSVQQTADIDWSIYDCGFVPISNFDLRSCDGGGYAVSSLRIDADGYAGLFAALNGAQLRDITLLDAAVNGTGSVGALAGAAESCEISDCCVRLAAAPDTAGAYDVCTVSGGTYVGGLVGRAIDSTLTDCFAAVQVSSEMYAGGLVGALENCSLTDCCSGGRTVNGAYAARRNVTAERLAGGLVGCIVGSAQLHGCYSTCSSSGGALLGSVQDVSAYPDLSDCYAAFAYSEDELALYSLAPAVRQTVTATAYPYDPTLGSAYPYASAGGVHYGDWTEGLSNVQLVYYEVYADGSAAFGCMQSGVFTAVSGTFDSENEKQITQDGYAVLSIRDAGSAAAGYLNGERVTLTRADFKAGGRYVYLVPAEDLGSRASLLTSLTVFDTGTGSWAEAYLIPAAAQEAYNSKPDSESQTLNIRTLRQLFALEAAFGDCAGRSFVQTHDFDGSTCGELAPAFSQTAFAGSYDGGGYVITNICLTADGDGAGLFGQTDGAELRNITLENVTVSGAAYCGGLVGHAHDTVIYRCGVRASDGGAYDSVGISGETVGGLVGLLDGCSEVTYSYAALSVYGETAGGLVGELADESTLRGCYASGRTLDGQFAIEPENANVYGASAAGGLVGHLTAAAELTTGGTLLCTALSAAAFEEGALNYAANSVGGQGMVGALIGWYDDWDSAPALPLTLPSCYAAGAVLDGAAQDTTDFVSALEPPERSADDVEHTDRPYDDSRTDYPFARIKADDGAYLPHIGDWAD